MSAFRTMKDVLHFALGEARRAGASRVVILHLIAQDNGGIDPQSDALQFQALAHGTLAEDARLQVDYGTSERQCWTCGLRFVGNGFDALCPQCGSPGLLLTHSGMFQLKSITIEKEFDLEHSPDPQAIGKPVNRTRSRQGLKTGILAH